MKRQKPVTMLCTYRPKRGKERQLLALLKKHWRILNKVGLTTAEPAIVYRAADKKSGQIYFVEVFSWRDTQASAVAHKTPEVMAIWEPMESILDSMDLAVIEPVGGKA